MGHVRMCCPCVIYQGAEKFAASDPLSPRVSKYMIAVNIGSPCDYVPSYITMLHYDCYHELYSLWGSTGQRRQTSLPLA